MARLTELVTLPLRVGLNLGGRVISTGFGLVRSVTGVEGGESVAPPREPAPEPPPVRIRPDERPPSRRRPPAPPDLAATAPPVETPPVVEDHVDEEPVLAGEFADPGAEEGAHAELTIEEPWEGYRRMRVTEIRDELAGAGRELLATVELYERAHKGRRMVLEAAARRLRELTPPGAAGNGSGR
jgi:hypothetical protein